MSSPFQRPNDTSPGGAGGGGCDGQSSGGCRVSTPIPPRSRAFPWPLPYSATQGSVGGAGGKGMVSVSLPPYSPAPKIWGPWEVLPQGWLPSGPVRS